MEGAPAGTDKTALVPLYVAGKGKMNNSEILCPENIANRRVVTFVK